MKNTLQYEFIIKNDKFILIEHDNRWGQRIVRAMGSNIDIKWIEFEEDVYRDYLPYM